jgi:replication initiator protein
MRENVEKRSSPKPRKDPWDPSDFTASVPIESGIIYTKVTGPYTAKDRKLWPVLVHHAWQNDDLLASEHSIPIAKISKLFSDHGGDNSARWIWDSTKRLAKTQLEWVNVSQRRKKAVGFSVLLSSAQIEKDELTDVFTLRYTLPEPLCQLLKDPDQYGRIRTQLLLSLSSKYTISLYEVLTTIINRDKPEMTVNVDQLRHWLKVPEGKLTKWHHLRQRALDPAVEELNSRSENSGFRVTYEVNQGPRNRVDSLTFRTEKTKEQLLEDKILQTSLHSGQREQLSLFDSEELDAVSPEQVLHEEVLRPLREDEFRKRVRKLVPGRDIAALEMEWLMWAQFKADFPPKDIQKAFWGFCRRKGGSKRSDD